MIAREKTNISDNMQVHLLANIGFFTLNKKITMKLHHGFAFNQIHKHTKTIFAGKAKLSVQKRNNKIKASL